MKKIRKSIHGKGKKDKKAQQRLEKQLSLLTLAKECHLCKKEFCSTNPGTLEWQIQISREQEVQLTCTDCV